LNRELSVAGQSFDAEPMSMRRRRPGIGRDSVTGAAPNAQA